jgi:hypothetical protein
MFIDYPLDSTNFHTVKSPAVLQPDWVKPELGNLIITLNMNMLMFISITSVEEKSILANSEYRWHLFIIRQSPLSPNGSHQLRGG